MAGLATAAIAMPAKMGGAMAMQAGKEKAKDVWEMMKASRGLK